MLKKLSYEAKRLSNIEALYSNLFKVRFFYSPKFYDINSCIEFLNEKSFLIHKDLKKIVTNKYGYDENDENSIEEKYTIILTIIFIFKVFLRYRLMEKNPNLFYVNPSMENFQTVNRQLQHLISIFPDFKILNQKYPESMSNQEFHKLRLEDFLPDYIPTKVEYAFNVLKKVPVEKAEPIAMLLAPNLRSDDELIGLMNKTYTEIEKVSANELNHLTNEDKIVFEKLKRELKFIHNQAFRHKSNSSLTKIAIKEMSVWSGFTATLLQKLLHKK